MRIRRLAVQHCVYLLTSSSAYKKVYHTHLTHTRAHPHTHTQTQPHTCFLTINDRTKFETFATASYIIAHWPRPPLPPPAWLPRPHSPAASVAKFTPNFIKIPISAYTQLQGKRNGSGEGKGNSCLAGTASPCLAHSSSSPFI